MPAKICKNILKGKKNIFMPSSDCTSAVLPFPHSSAQTMKPLSSYTIQAFTLIHHLQTVTSCITPRWMDSIVTLALLAFFASWLCEVFSGRCPIHSLSVLYLVSFDSRARLSSRPPQPLQASLSLSRQTEGIAFCLLKNQLICGNNEE